MHLGCDVDVLSSLRLVRFRRLPGAILGCKITTGRLKITFGRLLGVVLGSIITLGMLKINLGRLPGIGLG